MGKGGAAARSRDGRVSGSTVSFAFVAGTVATVNPCGFALLPAYLARRVGAEDGTRRSADAVSRALLVGAVTTAGFMLVFGTIGSAIGLGARELTRALPWAGRVLPPLWLAASEHLQLTWGDRGTFRVAGATGDTLPRPRSPASSRGSSTTRTSAGF